MNEKEIEIISIIDNEFKNLSINNLINELKKIPQYDFKTTRTFILKLFRDIDISLKNSKNRIKKYLQNLKSYNEQIIKKIYFHSRNKHLLSKYNTKDSTNINENLFYNTQTNINNNKDYINYDNIQSIKNLKSSDENSFKENDNNDIFNKNIFEMKYFSGNNGNKSTGMKFKKKINLGNKSLSEFKIKTKQKINLNNNKKDNFNLYKLYHKAHNNKNKRIIKDKNNKSSSTNNNKIQLDLNITNKEKDYFSNIKSLKKKNISKEKKIMNYNNSKLINNNSRDKNDNLKCFSQTKKNEIYNKNIERELKIKDYRNELSISQEKNPFKSDNKYNKNISNETDINNNNKNNSNLATDIIYFIEHMKELQKNIINKNPNIKEMKYNFEKKKYLLYQKALKLSNIINNENKNDIIKNDLKFNLNYKISKAFSIIIKNDKTSNNNNNINSDNTKELNISIINLRKTIEDIKNNSQFLTEQLKSEVNILNNKIKEKNEKEKEYEKNIIENLTTIKKIYKILLSNYLEKNNILNSKEIENNSLYYDDIDKKFNWYSNEILKYIDILVNKKKM